MNPEWFGDSYDVVKRFFVGALRELGYSVYVDPMTTGEWASESNFLKFIGARHLRQAKPGKTALLLDPDTGIGRRPSKRHTTIPNIAGHLDSHEIVFVFDQSFSRDRPVLQQLEDKLRELACLGVHGFFYDSHAHFLFASRSASSLASARDALIKTGLPSRRLVALATEASSPTRPSS